MNNNSVLKISKTIISRTQLYLEMSCNILQWFKEHYTHTGNKKDIVKLKDVYDIFCTNEYYFNLSKTEKRKYNKMFFIEYFKTNIFMREYYIERTNNSTNILKEWKIIDNEDIY
jgi:hypothetical protein